MIMKKQPYYHLMAFTLVELAIVLVIIGLIVGGILVGTDLITSAKINRQMKQVDEIKAAMIAFKLKYNCLPGDCANATSFLTGSSQPDQVMNGNGNGIISRGCGTPGGDTPTNGCFYSWPTMPGNEWKNVFDHLAAAGMYSFATYDETSNANNRAGIAYPPCAISAEGANIGGISLPGGGDCGVIVSYEFTAHYIRMGANPSNSFTNPNYTDFYTGLSPTLAYTMDTKFDDGKPMAGFIQVGSNGYQCGIGAWPAAGWDGLDLRTHSGYGVVGVGNKCANAAGDAYNNASVTTARVCSMRFNSSL